MSKKTVTLAGILADLRASQTYLEDAMDGVLSIERSDVTRFAHLDLVNARIKILAAVCGLIGEDWHKLWDLASVLKGPEEKAP